MLVTECIEMENKALNVYMGASQIPFQGMYFKCSITQGTVSMPFCASPNCINEFNIFTLF